MVILSDNYEYVYYFFFYFFTYNKFKIFNY